MMKILQHGQLVIKSVKYFVCSSPNRCISKHTYRQNMPPPDRWLDYSNVGKVIPGTNILCFKVPLKNGLLRQVPPEMWFSPKQLIDHVETEHRKLKLVIDLTFTTKYYFTEEFTKNGVKYLKVFTEGHVIPQDDVVHRFFDAVETTKAEIDENAVIGVHCTHGVNRTGYMVCRYMIERLAFKPDEAIQAFNAARGHDMERENYLADLRTKTFLEDYKNEGRHKLEQKKPKSTYNSHKHSERKHRSDRSVSQDKDHSHYDQRSGSHGYNGYNYQHSGSHGYDAYNYQHSGSHGYDAYNYQHSGSHGPDAHSNSDRRSSSHGHNAHSYSERRSSSHGHNAHSYSDRHSGSQGEGVNTNSYHGSASEDRYPYGEYTCEIEEGQRDMQYELDNGVPLNNAAHHTHQGNYRRQDSGCDLHQNHRDPRQDHTSSGQGYRDQGYRDPGKGYRGQGQDSRGQEYARSWKDDRGLSTHGDTEHSHSGQHTHQRYSSHSSRDHKGSDRRQSHEGSDRRQIDKNWRSRPSRDSQDMEGSNGEQDRRIDHPVNNQQRSVHGSGSQHDNNS